MQFERPVAISRMQAPQPPKRTSTRTSRVVRNGILVIASIAVIWVCQWARAFVIPLAVGIFLTCSLTPLVDRLQKTRVPRSLGAALVLAMLVAGICTAVYAL
jgi:predicted PurR-regulated permease PerM